jgi:predicted transglutaminase-like cysteine proteinase
MLVTKTTIRTLAVALVVAVVGSAAPTAAGQLNFAHTAFAPISGTTSIPIGHSEFCKVHREECTAYDRVVDAVVLDESRWQQLVEVNNAANGSIVPITDADLYQVDELWTYPDGYGDCEDIALAKRRQLIEAGWEPSTLLMAVVRERNGNGHAVLMVRTDRGDLVLDNQDGMVRVWTETPYQYVKRQSQQNAGIWVDIIDDRIAVASAQ